MSTSRGSFVAIIGGLVLLLGLAALVYWSPRRSAPPLGIEELRARYATPASRYVDVAGVRVHYYDEGAGPALLLLHGSFGSLQTFDDMSPLLRARYRVIRFDQPPTGLSGSVPEGFALTPEAFTQAFLERIGVGRVALFGTSSGGIFAYRYAATYPDAVTALVLANVPPSAPVDNAGARRRQPWLEQLSSIVCDGARPRSLTCWDDFLHSMFVRDERVTDALVERYYDYNRQPSAGRLTSIAAIMRKDDEVIGFLSRVRAPTLLIWGSSSPVLPPETATLLASRLTATKPELRRLERVAHYPPLEAPREVAEAMLEFLGRVVPVERVEPAGPGAP